VGEAKHPGPPQPEVDRAKLLEVEQLRTRLRKSQDLWAAHLPAELQERLAGNVPDDELEEVIEAVDAVGRRAFEHTISAVQATRVQPRAHDPVRERPVAPWRRAGTGGDHDRIGQARLAAWKATGLTLGVSAQGMAVATKALLDQLAGPRQSTGDNANEEPSDDELDRQDMCRQLARRHREQVLAQRAEAKAQARAKPKRALGATAGLMQPQSKSKAKAAPKRPLSSSSRFRQDVGAGRPVWLAAQKEKSRRRAQAHRVALGPKLADERVSEAARWTRAMETGEVLPGTVEETVGEPVGRTWTRTQRARKKGAGATKKKKAQQRRRKRTCNRWLEGRCSHGERCAFLHAVGGGGTGSGSSQPGFLDRKGRRGPRSSGSTHCGRISSSSGDSNRDHGRGSGSSRIGSEPGTGGSPTGATSERPDGTSLVRTGFRGQRVGEASLPGPRLWVLNTGGGVGVWRLLHTLADTRKDRPDVVILTEPRLKQGERDAVRRECRKQRFTLYLGLTPGDENQVAVLVRQDWRQRPGPTASERDATTLGIWVHGTLVLGHYQAPRPEATAEGLRHLQAVLTQGGAAPWVIAGDFNDPPEHAPAAAEFEGRGGRVLRTNLPTRWDGRREIDWAAAFPAGTLLPPSVKGPALSDHKLLEFEWTLRQAGSPQMRWAPLPKYPKPAGLDQAIWREAIAEAWRTKVPPATLTGDVDADWQRFLAGVEMAFREAAEGIRRRDDVDQGVHTELTAMLRNQHSKAVFAEPTWLDPPRHGAKLHGQPLEVLKQRRALARLFEAQRLLQGGKSLPDGLRGRLAQWWRRYSNIDYGDQQANDETLMRLQRHIHEQEAEMATTRLKRWRERMVEDIGAVSRWLKRRRDQPMLPIAEGARVSETPGEAAGMVCRFWQEKLQRPEDMPTEAAAAADMCRHLPGSPPGEARPGHVTAEELEQAFRAAKGTHGPDGWAGAELRHLPSEAITRFAALVAQWIATGSAPTCFREARQVTLLKMNKVPANARAVPAEATRPITVLSVWWRIYLSAVVKAASTTAWRRTVFHPSIAYGAGSAGAEVVAAQVNDTIQVDGFGGTLDFSNCFDLMRPAVTARLLEHTGWDPALVRTMQSVWGATRRWVEMDGWVQPQPLEAGGATAQGCPFSPLALGLWTTAGVREVLAAQGPGGQASMFIYMDDRSMACKTPEALLQMVRDWASWSQRVGLRENSAKIQLTAVGKKRKQRLAAAMRLEGLPRDLMKSSMEILGCSTAERPRKLTEKEASRLRAASSVAARVGGLPVPYSLKRRYLRTFATSVALYGWVAHSPGVEVARRFQAGLKRALGRHRSGSAWLEAILFGGAEHLDVLLAGRKASMVLQLRGTTVDVGAARPRAASLYGRLGTWLRARGWTWAGDGAWTHPAPGASFNLLDVERRGCLHALRQGWRHWNWERFVGAGQSRRLAVVARTAGETLADFDVSLIRNLAIGDGAIRSVALGAVQTPAAMASSLRLQAAQGRCVWDGCEEMGHWEHMAWQCPRRPSLLRRPASAVGARLGWPRLGQADGEEIARWLGQVQARIWQVRYGTRQAFSQRPPTGQRC
jgi:hypothetical protein